MKKVLTVVLAVVAALSLAACAGKGKAPIGKGKAPVVVTRG
jgi:predicted small lipoprotein YifL